MLQMSVNSGPRAAPNAAPARTLAQLPEGEAGVLDRLELPDDIARRLMELGFLPGHIIVPARSAPGGEPACVSRGWLGSRAAARNRIAPHPRRPASERSRQGFESMSDCHGCAGCAVAEAPPSSQGRASARGRHHWSAELRQVHALQSPHRLAPKGCQFPRRHRRTARRQGQDARRTDHDDVVLVDLPGVYSLNPRSEDEQVTRDVLAGTMPGIPKPDAVLLDPRLHQPGPPPGAGRAHSQPETADAGHPQHGGRSEEPRRRTWTRPSSPANSVRRSRSSAPPKAKASKKSSSSWKARRPAPPRWRLRASSFRSCRTFRAAASGRTTLARARPIVPPRRPYGRAVWIRSSCIPSPGR